MPKTITLNEVQEQAVVLALNAGWWHSANGSLPDLTKVALAGCQVLDLLAGAPTGEPTAHEADHPAA